MASKPALMFLLLAAVLAAANASAAESPPAAEWIWAGRSPESGQQAYVRQEFEVAGDVQAAELRGAADFNHATVLLNGRAVAEVENYSGGFRGDVRSAITPGVNVLAAYGRESDGPAAVALSLTLVFSDGRRQTTVSDASWQASTKETAGWEKPSFVPDKSWSAATNFGAAMLEADRDAAIRISEADDYTQWERALGTAAEAEPSKFRIAPGFEIELLRSARPEEGSWISLEFDPQGRAIISREDRGLLRMTLGADNAPAKVETINDTLEECRGLLYAHGSLYASANNSKALYRLRDTNGDDQYDDIKLIYACDGGVGHGRNDLALGPDGKIYAIFGDDAVLPKGLEPAGVSDPKNRGDKAVLSISTKILDRTSPFRRDRGDPNHEGHLLRLDPDGAAGEIIAAGLRNPYGIDFNADGEPFTYDADAEFDMGAPWYRPTRIDHLVSGADFGWRAVTQSWPPYYPDHPDNATATFDVGKGSPTAVKFGVSSHFPEKYRRALFVLDWAYGRVLAVHLTPRGASYAGAAETFLQGQPLNATDLAFGPDGAMYILTGGRKTQSGLYRVRYSAADSTEPAGAAPAAASAQEQAVAEHARVARGVRRQLEAFHGQQNPARVETAWPYLNTPDPALRYAARVAIEHQPIEAWQERAFAEERPLAAATALMALARSPATDGRPKILARLNDLPVESFTATARLASLYTYRLCLTDPQRIDGALLAAALQRLVQLFPDASPEINQELSRLLTLLESPQAPEKILQQLRITEDQPLRMHYLFVLRNATRGWTPELRETYFLSLKQMQQFQGGEGMPRFIRQIEADALASLSETERTAWAPRLAEDSPADQPAAATRPFVRDWKLEELIAALPAVQHERDLERGRELFSAALCVRCHRVGELGAAHGPDLTAVGSRFSPQDILKSIVVPSEVVAEQYRRVQVSTAQGQVIVGQIVPSRDYRSPSLSIAADPLHPEQVVEISKSEIESLVTQEVSPMPEKLLNTLTEDEILDLLAWLQAGGDRRRLAEENR